MIDEDDEKEETNSRIADDAVQNEIERYRYSFDGYQNRPLMTLDEAIIPLLHIIKHLPKNIVAAKKKCCKLLSYGIAHNESAALYLFTAIPEVFDGLNASIRSKSRLAMKPWFSYLKLLLSALYKLPTKKGTFFLFERTDAIRYQEVGNTVFWWGFTQVWQSLQEILLRLKVASVPTDCELKIFQIECEQGKCISSYSHPSFGRATLLLPARPFTVLSSNTIMGNWPLIHIKETISPFYVFPSPFSSNIKQETETSYFYNACRTDNQYLVELFLEVMSVEEINHIEANGETALHVTSTCGHDEVVKLLLKYGASRSLRNNYERTPYDVTKKQSTKILFARESGTNRFGGDPGQLTWMKVDPKAADWAAYERQRLHKFPDITEEINTIMTLYLEKELREIGGIDIIKYFCRKSKEEHDPIFTIKAYTAQTPFVNILNEGLATKPSSGDSQSGRRAFMEVVFHPDLSLFDFIGRTYRGMRLTEKDLLEYGVGSRVMNYSFLSTSKQRNIAEIFACVGENADGILSAMCTYITKNYRTALAIEELSEYPFEEEVLILPYSAFEVIDVQQNNITKSSVNIEIILEECDRVKPRMSRFLGVYEVNESPDVVELLARHNQNKNKHEDSV